MSKEKEYIQVGEHQYELPPLPPKSEIFFHDLPKAEQYWKRQEDLPKIFYDWYHPYKDGTKWYAVEENTLTTEYEDGRLIKLSKEDTKTVITFRDREARRMRDGVWFMNNGVPVYLPGNYYGVLQWCQFKGSVDEVSNSKYGMFMKLQLSFCYFLEICRTTPLARGGNVVKPKKTGITQLMACWILIEAIKNKTSLYRIMSVSEKAAIASCMAYLKYALERMPAILTPFIGKENMSLITFGKPDGTKGNKNKRVDTSIEFLETTISTVATAARSFDMLTNMVAWIDEQSKIIEASPKEIHNVTVATVMIGSKRHGFIIYTHYVSEVNDNAFLEARKIYYDSKLSTIKEGGAQTASNLICFALNVWDGIQGCIDKFGEPIPDAIRQYLNSEIARCGDDRGKMQAVKRQYPNNEAECWEIGAGENSVFDSVRLGLKLSELNKDAAMRVYPYNSFNFKWDKEPVMDAVKEEYKFFPGVSMVRVSEDDFHKGVRGLWNFYREDYLPNGFISEWSNRVTTGKNGKLAPYADCPFYMSMDPTGMAGKKEVVSGSKTSMQCFILPNAEMDGEMGRKWTNKRLIASYLHRLDNPMDSLMHCIHAIMFFGCYILVECNQMWVYNRLIKYGFENFLIVLDENGVLVPYRSSDTKQKPFTSQTSTIGSYVFTGREHYGAPDAMTDFDNIEMLDDENVINDLILFDPSDTKKFDAGVCHLIGLLGISAHMGWKVKMSKKTDGSLRHVYNAFKGLL